MAITLQAQRTERDSMGPVDVSLQALWGAQTQRALGHYAISSERLPPAFIHAMALVKRGAARVNAALGLLDADVAHAIERAADEVLAGLHADAFPLAVWQSGSGTQSHMNMNEVLANRASELLGGGRGEGRLVHPHDHVNLGQSSNDVVPTAIHLAVLASHHGQLLPALQGLRHTLATQASTHALLCKTGRTHLQDALPVTWGQELAAWVAQLDQASAGLAQATERLHALAVGGTAVGTGLNTHPQFGDSMVAALGQSLALPLRRAENALAAQAAHDALVATHGALKVLAVALTKIANDVRWLASGPRCGLGELRLPAVEPGSSAMPGKINPGLCEALLMVCAQVQGNDVAVALGGTLGHFELNTAKPLLAHNLLQSQRLLADGMRAFHLHAVRGMVPNEARMAEQLGQSLMLATALVPHLGHDRTATIVARAHAEGSSLRSAALASGWVLAADFDHWVRPEHLV